MMRDALHPAATESKHEPVAEGPAAAPEEQQLVAAVIRKDRKATAEFVGRFADPVHAYVRQRLAPRTDVVDDLVQEVFLAALKGLPAFAGRSSLRSWLLGIARHKVEDHYRAHLRRSETMSAFADESAFVPVELPRFDELIDQATLREKTRRVLSRLPEAYSYALLWRYWEKRSVREIAAETGRTEKAGERLLARGARAVQTAVGDRLRGMVDSDRFFSTLADETGPDPAGEPAPARLKSRIYSRLLAEQAATGRLLSVSETRESGRSLCVFEAALSHAPLPERLKSMNPCTVCHARHLAERLDHAPIFWPRCPYSEYHRG